MDVGVYLWKTMVINYYFLHSLSKRYTPMRQTLLLPTRLFFSWMIALSAVAVAMAHEAAVADESVTQPKSLRGAPRRLPYDTDIVDFKDMETAELAFLVGFLFAMFLLCCMVCFCCGGGTRCSLWDCLALLCIWEICCDGRNPTDFVAI